jgi:hypothetical protein
MAKGERDYWPMTSQTARKSPTSTAATWGSTSAPRSSKPSRLSPRLQNRHIRQNAAAAQKPRISRDDAAKESNLPSRGLPGPASFEVPVLQGFYV